MFTRYDTARDKVFVVVIYAVMALLTLAFIYPFWDQAVLSLSTRMDALKREIRLYPWPISLAGYTTVLGSAQLHRAFLVTVGRVVVGTTWTLLVTALAAYPLSRPNCPFKGFFVAFFLFTMMFSGGMIPNYLLRKSLNLIDKFLVMILPGISAWNIIIMRNFFISIPEEIQESAKLDGASDIGVFWRIILPLSKPVLATIALWSAVGHWNAYFDVLIYIHDHTKYTLQIVLRRVLLEGELTTMQMGVQQGEDISRVSQPPTTETVKAALLMVTTLPILFVYPFVQRYFVKGIMLGSLKG